MKLPSIETYKVFENGIGLNEYMNNFLSPFRIVLCFLVFALLGIFVIPFLKVELNPSPKLHSLTVRFSLPNSSPEIVENQATARLENALSSSTNLKEINSISNYNQGQITLKFDKETDLQLKKFEISMLIRQIYPTLISSLSYPLVEVSDGQNKQEKTPSLTYSINAPFSAFEIKNKLESSIKPYFSSISEIEEVEIKTPSNQILKIKYNQDKLNAYNLSEQKLKNELQTRIETSYLGFYPSTNNSTNFWVQVPPSFSVSSLNNLILSQKPLIRFADVASFDFVEDIPPSFYRINGQDAITLSFFVRSESNKIKVVNEIKSKLESLNLPKDYQIFKEYDETEYLEKELDKTYKRAFLSVLILCFFILLLERNIKYLFVLLSSLVVNILITALFAYFLKINIHLYSLAGIAISFGLILDNAIVMLNELHHNSKNQNNSKTNNLFLALFAASLTTISALLLVFFLPEEDQKNLLDFASIVALTVFVSLPIALWFTPSLYSLFFKNTSTLWNGNALNEVKVSATYTKKRIIFYIFKGYIFIIEFLRRFKKAVIFGLILLFGIPIFLLPPKIEEKQEEITFYGNFYNQTIGSKLYQEEIRPHSDAYLGGMLRLFVRYAYEKFSYREAEQIQLHIQAKMPEGTTILQMNEALKTIEDFLKNENNANQNEKNIEKFVTQVYTRQGRIIISFSEKQGKRNYPIQLKNKLIARSIDLDGVKWNIYGVGHQGFSTPDQTKLTSFRVQLKGYNYLQVEQEAEKLAQKLLTHKRIQEVNINERNSYFENTDKVIFLNPSLKELAYQNQNSSNLTHFLEQKTPSAYSEMDLPYQNGFISTKIEEEKTNDFSLYDIKNGSLKNKETQIPFVTFSTLQTQVSANSIYKENRQYLRIVGYDYFGSEHFGQTHLDKTLEEFKPNLPLGYSFKQLENNFYSSEKAKTQYGLLGILMLLIFFICSILFESLRQAFLILCVVPLSFIGIFITFGEFQIYFDQGGYASFVLVGGLCVNASIFIINDYNFLKKQKNNRNAFYKATFKKAVPILLTVVSTFLGLTPFLWEGQSEIFWFSLAAGTTGGLVFSLFCVFFVLPIFFIEEKDKFR